MKARTILPAALAIAALARLGSPAPAQKPPAADAQSLIDQCRSAGQLASATDCASGTIRMKRIEQSTCPDKRAATACRSFQELLHDNDAGLIDDIFHQDHLYICFIPDKDEFFKVTYAEPSAANFTTPSPEQLKEGVPPGSLTASGESDFAYFESGVRVPDSSFHNLGNWIYLSPVAADPDTVRQSANFRLAHFKGKNIEIADDEWQLAETYQDDADTTIKHTVTIQLATGRFRQAFAVADSGKVQLETNGRCLIAPSTGFQTSGLR